MTTNPTSPASSPPEVTRSARPVARRRWLRRGVALVLLLLAAASLFDVATRIDPPPLAPPAPHAVTYEGETSRVGDAYLAPFQHIGILSLEFHVDKLSRPLL